MRDKDNQQASVCDAQAAGTLAASSVARYFKDKQWKIISFFPNSVCAKPVPRQLPAGKTEDKKPE